MIASAGASRNTLGWRLGSTRSRAALEEDERRQRGAVGDVADADHARAVGQQHRGVAADGLARVGERGRRRGRVIEHDELGLALAALEVEPAVGVDLLDRQPCAALDRAGDPRLAGHRRAHDDGHGRTLRHRRPRGRSPRAPASPAMGWPRRRSAWARVPSRVRGGERERQGLGVRARAQRIVGLDELLERDVHRVVGDRRRSTTPWRTRPAAAPPGRTRRWSGGRASDTLSVASPAVLTTFAVVLASYSFATPGRERAGRPPCRRSGSGSPAPCRPRRHRRRRRRPRP